jgi:hypothetical protein
MSQTSVPTPGGWTDWSFDLTEEAKKVFKEALHVVGVKYTPLAFATQVVAGENYCFLCQQKAVYPNAPDHVVLVYIYQPLGGHSPYITHITKITP